MLTFLDITGLTLFSSLLVEVGHYVKCSINVTIVTLIS